MVGLERALLKLLAQALPSMYLKPFHNVHSNAIDQPISVILDSLLTTYGRVPEEELLTEESNLRTKVFDITEPLVILYNKMDDLQQLADAAGLRYTDAQFLNIGIRLIKNMNDFEKGLTDWYDLPVPRTWLQFKTHFTTAQNNLRKVRGHMMQSGVYCANKQI